MQHIDREAVVSIEEIRAGIAAAFAADCERNGVSVEDWTRDLTEAEIARAADTAELYATASLEQGASYSRAVDFGVDVSLGQARASVLCRRFAAARAAR